jgi:hypothetical protein
MTIANVRRAVVAVSVAAGAGIGLGSLLLQPVMPDDPAEFAATLASSPGAGIGMQLFVFSQLFWAVGLIGVGHLASRRAPVLATLGAVLSGLGAFGHAVYGGAMLTQLALASNTDAAVAAVLASETTIFLPYFVGGLLGTTLGLVLIAVAAMRARVAPLWVTIGLLVWVAIEFALPSLVDWSKYLSFVVGVTVFGGLAVAVWRSDLNTWRTAAETSDTASERPAKQTAAA